MKKVAILSLLVLSVVVFAGCNKNTSAPADTTVPTADSAQPTAPAEVAAPAVNLEETTKLAECLTNGNVIMYGTEWCGHCKNQKDLFGEAFAKVTYVDCDAERQRCLDAGVRGFPTWIDAQGNQYPGTQQLERLSEIGACTGQPAPEAEPTVEAPAEEVAPEAEPTAEAPAEEVVPTAEEAAPTAEPTADAPTN